MSLRDTLSYSPPRRSVGFSGTLPTRKLIDAKSLTNHSIQTYTHSEKDLLFLDQIQIQTASAREFLIGLRFMKEDDILPTISRVEKLLKEQGFFARLAIKDDLKRILAVYFAQNMTQVVLDDYDGERWFGEHT